MMDRKVPPKLFYRFQDLKDRWDCFDSIESVGSMADRFVRKEIVYCKSLHFLLVLDFSRLWVVYLKVLVLEIYLELNESIEANFHHNKLQGIVDELENNHVKKLGMLIHLTSFFDDVV